MKNLKPYPDDCFEFYEAALQAKDSDDLKLRLVTIAPYLKASYEEYEARFAGNELELLMNSPAFRTHKKDLLSLYSYQFSAIKKLRLAIANEQPQPVRFTCQHCTLTSNESLDHFVPKDEFPQYAMNPYNLVPSCGKCNQHKSFGWRDRGRRTALNLYLDQLPQQQYLFVDVIFDEYAEIDFEFYLDNINGVDGDMFTLLRSHFTNLNLLERMREKAIPVISELQNSITARLANLPYVTIAEEIKATAEADKVVFGQNYWKSIVQIELIDSTPFLQLMGI